MKRKLLFHVQNHHFEHLENWQLDALDGKSWPAGHKTFPKSIFLGWRLPICNIIPYPQNKKSDLGSSFSRNNSSIWKSVMNRRIVSLVKFTVGFSPGLWNELSCKLLGMNFDCPNWDGVRIWMPPRSPNQHSSHGLLLHVIYSFWILYCVLCIFYIVSLCVLLIYIRKKLTLRCFSSKKN